MKENKWFTVYDDGYMHANQYSSAIDDGDVGDLEELIECAEEAIEWIKEYSDHTVLCPSCGTKDDWIPVECEHESYCGCSKVECTECGERFRAWENKE